LFSKYPFAIYLLLICKY